MAYLKTSIIEKLAE